MVTSLVVKPLDTGRLNPETYQLFDEVEKHFGIKIEFTFPDEKAVTDLVNEKGMFSFFEDGHNIGDHQVLVDVARDIGLDADIVADLLKSDADVDNVRGEAEAFRQMGVSGVPTYIANRAVAVQGAESAEKLARFLKHAAAQLPQERPAG